MLARHQIQSFGSCLLALCAAGSLVMQAEESVPHFEVEIVPMLTKAGCNAGACHGAATGKGGFKLSLFAEDAQADYEAITRDRFARRLNPDHPEESLILKKASRQLDHEGGRRIRRSSEDFARLRQWIRAGAPAGDPAITCESIQVSPAEIIVGAVGDSADIRVEARMSDGSRKDVTQWSVFESMDDGIADVTGSGEVILQRHGVTSIMIRFGSLTGSTRVGLPFPSEGPSTTGMATHLIDITLHKEWAKWHLRPSESAQRHQLIRRLFLDLTGQLPTEEEAKHWTQVLDTQDGYDTLVQHLLSTNAFTDYWSLHCADWLLLDSKKLGLAAKGYFEWLRSRIRQDASMLDTVSELVRARGSFIDHPPSNFQRHAGDPRDMAEYVGQTLLGARIACARCHNHPVDQWTLTDYHDFAAIFAKTGLDDGQALLKDLGDVPHPKSGKASQPRPLGMPKEVGKTSVADPLQQFGTWLEQDGAERFGRAFANRIWKKLFGRGVVEPVDDLRATNPPSIPHLLDTMVAHWSDRDHRLRALVKLIVTSTAYRQEARFDATPGTAKGCFNAMQPRSFEGRVLVDAIRGITEQTDYLQSVLEDNKAIASWDHRQESYALDVLGRCQREDACDEENVSGGGLSKSLYLFNDPELQQTLEQTAQRWCDQFENQSAAMVQSLYWRAFARSPHEEELRHWVGSLDRAADKHATLADLMWAVLNSREFIWIH